MTPTAYVETIVIPTLREAMAARDDRRPNYLACIVIFHVLDYIAAARGERVGPVRGAVERMGPAVYEVARGICNGTKHAGNQSGNYRHVPGGELEVPEWVFDVDGAGWDEGRIDHPGLAVTFEGQDYFLDHVAQLLLLRICRRYPDELGAVDLSFLDPGISAHEQLPERSA
ncbi:MULTISPECIES: hypothetical protein [unclassified Methylobacterium]|uniref:hypothetical protein n=1 Tax=unclassified Methylobacterium TaxID=2615210 RepID=UPI00226A7B88|nr:MULTISPECIES: hypothetical protein [unclassified Methylobacterium]